MNPPEPRADGPDEAGGTASGASVSFADRLAIEDLLIRYCTAIDDHDWALMDTVFEPDALWDSSAVGGVAGVYREIRAWQERELASFAMTHHLSNITVTIDGAGATATATSYASAPIIPIGPDGPGTTFVVGASYHDRLVRTADGWRIAERIERSRWMLGGPPSVPT